MTRSLLGLSTASITQNMPDTQPAQAEQQEEGGVRKWMGIAQVREKRCPVHSSDLLQNALLIWGVIQFGKIFPLLLLTI